MSLSGVIFPNSRSFLSHVEICRTMNYSAASMAHTHTSNANIGHFAGRNNNRDFLKNVISQTLVGDYWARERRDISHNEGRFPARSWEIGRTAQGRNSGISSAGQPGNEIVLINIADNVDPPMAQANQYR